MNSDKTNVTLWNAFETEFQMNTRKKYKFQKRVKIMTYFLRHTQNISMHTHN